MRSSRSLFVITAVTLLSLALDVISANWALDIFTAGPFALVGFVLFVVLQTLLVPVFFAALYVDIGVARASADPWSPSRWLWVGGGALAALAAYLVASNTTAAVVLVGVAYLGRRFYAATRGTAAAEPEPAAGGDATARSVAGVSVHVLALAAAAGAYVLTSDIAGAALAFGGVAAVVFAASEHSFTRANARNALNWSLSVLAFATVLAVPSLLYAMDGQFYGYTVSGPLFPPALDAAAKTGSVALVVVALLAVVATIPLAAFATWRAAMGAPWSYPLAASVIERLT
ncbi:DUF4870 domain-containing protein [Halobacterium salinarum]|uniref:DUF4870 domain-containing protein n=1 Tax=Halobacterium salinarum TaxID=2242 RepID=UPI0025541500|nr:DUF4870 domain-containing protein [Halobacterium salinarum]MDL0125087.1 DUF4870 domain-containing protein [Halobacterium salinarum]